MLNPPHVLRRTAPALSGAGARFQAARSVRQRAHWNVTVREPSTFVVMVDVIGMDPARAQ